MNRLGWKMTGIMAGFLLLSSGIVAQEESGDAAHETTSGIPYEPQILKYGLENLNTLKQVLPDLHAEVISPDWMELSGSDKLQLVVNSMTNVWGANEKDINDYLSRLDQYESSVPPDETKNVEMFFDSIAEHLLIQFFLIEQYKETIQPLIDVYSIIWEDEDPGKLVEYERCLNQNIVTMGTNTKKTFADWLDGVEKVTADTEMLKPHISLHSKAASELVNWVTIEHSAAQNKCNPDWESDS